MQVKFDDAHLHTPHGKRSLGVTMLSNLSVSEQAKLKVSGHKSMKAYARYQQVTGENLEKKYEAMNPSLRSDSSSHNSVETRPHSISKVLTRKNDNVMPASNQ